MGSHQNIIEINGKRYDAITGELLSSSVASKPAAAVSQTPKPAHAGQGVSMDGFSRRPPTSTTQKHTTSSHAAPTPTHRPEPQKSHTLMRSAVKKPTQPLSPVAAPKKLDTTKKSAAQILGHSERRDKIATTVNKSNLVHRYSSAPFSKLEKKVAELRVQQPPAATTPRHGAAHITPTQGDSISRVNKANHLIDAALANATSHLEQKHIPKKKRLHHKLGISAKTMSISSAVMAFVILGGFYAYLNVPNFAMRVAATRAGFDASMPGYKPAGFSYRGPINYSAGQVTVTFKSNTDDRAYVVSQRSSNWNSETLLTNYVATQNKPFQTLQEKGRTLYIYGGSNATWIDNGVWYQIEGDSRMTTDQISRIAASL